MATISKLEVYGPKPALQLLAKTMISDTPQIHTYKRVINTDEQLHVLLYEDQQTAVQTSRCVVCIISEENRHINLEIADIGKQSGFRSSSSVNEEPVFDQIMEFILDFGKQHGLTIQKKQV